MKTLIQSQFNSASASSETRPRHRYDWIWYSLPALILAYVIALFLANGRTANAADVNHWAMTSGMAMLSALMVLLGTLWLNNLVLMQRQRRALTWSTVGSGAFMISFLPLWPMLGPGVNPQAMGPLLFVILISILSLLAGWTVGVLSPWALIRDLRGVASGDLKTLTKVNLNTLVLCTTLAGFYMASRGQVDWWLAGKTLFGTALVAMGASVFNQYDERTIDSRMERTADRPLPAGRMLPPIAFGLGVWLTLMGLAWLLLMVNVLAAYLAALTLAVYVFLYTPLKRINSLSTLAGGISGALPPVIGWAAASQEIGPMAVILFFVLFLWQMPHFLSLCWKYREEYRRAGFPMYCVDDEAGTATGRVMLVYAVALVGISLMPTLLGYTGWIYFSVALMLGLLMALLAVQFLGAPQANRARSLFLSTIAYLPLLLIVMAFDKLGF